MKRIVICVLFFASTYLKAQNADSLFKRASSDFHSFGEAVRNDSILNFKSHKGYVPTLIHNLGYQATSPLRLKGKDFIYLGGVVVITSVLLHYDQEIDNYVRPIKDKNPFIKTVSPEVTELGDYYGYILLAGYGSYSILFHKYKALRTSLLASQAAITAGLWIRVGKILSGRMRPEATYVDKEFNSDHWFGPFAQFQEKYSHRSVAAFDAFPSGHTGAAFAMATVISEQYKDHKAVPIVMYSLAGIVAVTRLIEHTHWASDVFLGGVIGYLCGKQVVKNEKKLFPDYSITQRKSSSVFYPYASNGNYGAGWMMTF